jgi:hypothetical protein
MLDQLALLESAMYRPDASFDTVFAVAATRQWLLMAWRHHPTRKAATAAQLSSPAESSHA